MSFKFKYPGEMDFLFETILGYESGDQVGTFDEKIWDEKSHAVSMSWPRLTWACAVPVSDTVAMFS